jgi:hypothetical protein
MNTIKQFRIYQEAARIRKLEEAAKRRELRVMFWFVETYNGKYWATNHSSLALAYGFTTYKEAAYFVRSQMAAITI